MAKIDVSVLPRIDLVRDTITVSDPRCPGKEFSFDFAFSPVTSEAEDLLLFDRAQRFEETYVKGDLPILAPGGLRVPVEQSLCFWISRLTAAEGAAGALETNGFKEWAIFAALMPSAWHELTTRFSAAETRVQGRETRAGDDETETAGGAADGDAGAQNGHPPNG